MPTQTIHPLDPSAAPVTLTYEGVSESDAGPAAAVLRMVIAQAKGDADALKEIVTEKTLEMSRSQNIGSQVEMIVKGTKIEGDTATVTAELKSDGMGQELPVIVVKQAGRWRVDMHATIEKLMGGMDIAAALEQGMKQMAEGMGKVMEQMAKGASAAFGGQGDGEDVKGSATRAEATPKDKGRSRPRQRKGRGQAT